MTSNSPTEERQQWEYIVREVDNTLAFGKLIKIGGAKFSTLEEFLNMMGQSGWELCGTDSRNIQFVFKRTKSPNPITTKP